MSDKKRVYSIFDKSSNNANWTVAKKRKPEYPLRILSWNVAGLRACVKKNFIESVTAADADIVFLQETKCDVFPPEVLTLPYPIKHLVPSKVKKGHAGVAMLSREKPISVNFGFGEKKFDDMGRWIHAEFDNFHIIGTYVINSGDRLQNLPLRHEWEIHVAEKLLELDKEKPVIYTGDLNVAHNEIDLRNAKANLNKSAGFTDQERADFSNLLKCGFIDVYRNRFPDEKDCYTYWSYLSNSRARNTGWRIDYFVVSERLLDKVVEVTHLKDVYGSDHCPIQLSIQL